MNSLLIKVKEKYVKPLLLSCFDFYYSLLSYNVFFLIAVFK